MKNFGSAIEAARRAAKIAIDRSVKTVGGENDSQLRIYGRLKPEDFQKLVAAYGAESVISYVRAMEQKRKSQGGNNA